MPVEVRPAVDRDLPALTDIYNHYVIHTPITFDVTPFQPGQRRAWYDDHATSPRHRLVVAEDGGRVVGYASSSRWRPKPAYDTTVETTVYCRAGATGRGIGTLLYRGLFELLADADVDQIVAGVTLPNPASVALHRRLGFRPIGVFAGVGRKFDQYWDVGWFQRPMKLT